jgi:hypothetical protein
VLILEHPTSPRAKDFSEPDPPAPPPQDDDSDRGDSGRWITVATFSLPQQAQIARLRLESEDIDCFLIDENLVATDWLLANAVGGIKLQVREEDAAQARQILDARSADPKRVLSYEPSPTSMAHELARFPTATEAHMAAAILDAEGIPVDVIDPSFKYGMTDGPATLRIAIDDRDLAIEILSATPAAKYLDVEYARPAASAIVCPSCQSDDVYQTWFSRRLFFIAMLIGIPIPLPMKFWRCSRCGHEWRPASRRSQLGSSSRE